MMHLNSNDKIENQPVIVRQINKKVGQNGREYYHLQVSTGLKSYDAKIWNNSEEISRDILPGCVAYITGTAKDFKGTLQIHIEKIVRLPNPDQELIDMLTPTCEQDVEKLKCEFNKIVDTIKEPMLNTLIKLVFDSTIVKNNFYKKAAGAEIHHAYLGGLAQHTIEVAKIVINFCSMFREVNYDTAVTAALLHDIGKVAELSNFPENKYTNRGRLIGHISLGVQMVDSKIAEIDDFPQELKLEIEHCILSHHGNLETGSPVVPMTLEAIAVHNADKSSAEINSFTLAIQRDTGTGDWTEYSNAYKRYIKKKS